MTSSRAERLRSYWELSKPRLSALAVFAVVAGAFMAWPAKTSSPPLDLLVFTTLGNFLAAAGAAAPRREGAFDEVIVAVPPPRRFEVVQIHCLRQGRSSYSPLSEDSDKSRGSNIKAVTKNLLCFS